MPKEPQGHKVSGERDRFAVRVVKIATGEIEETTLKQPAKRKSGLTGVKARMAVLESEKRHETAREAAEVLWETKRGDA